jgi:tetratricopeptide (TPR) repeat protein
MAAPVAARQAVWKELYANAEALAASHQWADAYQAATGVAEAAEKNHPKDRLKAAKSYALLGRICANRGGFRQSFRFYRKALQGGRSLHGSSHPIVVNILHEIGELHRMHAKYDAAERYFQEAVDMARAIDGSLHSYAAPSFERLGDLKRDRGEIGQAESLYRQALIVYELRRKYHPREDFRIARTLRSLGEVAASRGDFAEAAMSFKKAVTKYSHCGSSATFALAGTVKRLAELYAEWKKPAEALPNFKRALALYEKADEPDNLMLAAVLMGLVNLHKRQKNYSDAEAFFNRAVAIYERNPGVDHAVASRLLKSKPVWPTLTHTLNRESK